MMKNPQTLRNCDLKFTSLSNWLRSIVLVTISMTGIINKNFAQEQSVPCGDQYVCFGNSIPDLSISCTCTGDLPAAFLGPGVTTIDNVIYSFNANGLMQPGTYILNADCSSGQDYIFWVTVEPAIIATINGSANPSALAICGNASTNLVAAASGGDNPYEYSWSPSAGLNNANINNPIASPTSTTTYILTVTDDNGCVDNATITLNVNNFPLNISASDETICAGQSVTLNFSGGIIGQYNLSNNNGTSLNLPGTSFTLAPSQTTTYNLNLNGTTCETPDQVTVQVFPQPSISLTGTPAINGACNGSVAANVSYSGSINNLVYNWTLNGVPITGNSSSLFNCCAGTYVCNIVGLNGCSASATYVLENIVVPAFTITPGNDICNVGCGGTLSVSSQSPFTIQWNAPLNSNSPYLDGLCAGTYSASITFTGYPAFVVIATVNEAAGNSLAPISSFYSIANQTVVVNGNVQINNGGTLFLNQNATLIVYGDIIVEAGGKLDLFSATIKMQTDKKIIIKPGALVESEFGVFTSACSNEFWRGIEIWGQGNLSQTISNQGKANLQKNTLVERAHVALRVARSTGINAEQSGTGGGIIDASQLIFKNNRRDVQFIKYNPTNLPTDNISKFTGCQFLVDQNAYFSTLYQKDMQSRIQMSQVNSVEFYGCMIHNSHAGWVDMFSTVAGVQANQSPFIWQSGSIEGGVLSTSISGLGMGMTLSNQLFSTPYRVKDCTFRCYRGINMTTIGNISVIENNTFYSYGTNIGFPQVPVPFMDTWPDSYVNFINSLADYNAKNAYCLYLNSPSGIVKIIDNYFNLTGPANLFTVGVYVNGNGGWANDIKGNYFGGMTHGCYFYNINRNTASQGLQFSCNVFEANGRDININKKPGTAFGTNSLYGIKPILNAGANISLGNNFSASFGPVEKDDMFNGGSMQTHNYVYAAGELVPSEVSTSINLSFNSNNVPQNCPFTFTGSASLAMVEKLNYYNALKSTYDLLIDGGNTEFTLETIEVAQYAEAFELYDNLMAKSPALSREVMIEIIRKETELPAVLLTAILTANPSAAKDAVVQKELDNRSNQLTTYQRALIDQGLIVLSSKENIEAAMANTMAAYYQLLSYEYLRLTEEYTGTALIEAQETLMSQASDGHGLWLKTIWLAGQNRYEEAYNVGIEAFEGLRSKSDHKLDWSNYLTMLQTLIAWTANPAFVLSEAEQKSLVEQMDDSQPSTKGLILQTLLQYGNYDLEFDTSYPIDDLGTRSMSISKTNDSPTWITVYPNPVEDYFSIRLVDAPTSAHATYVLTDVTGRQLFDGRLNSNNVEIIVNSTLLKAGSYALSIFDEGHLIHTEKLVKK
jgi:hypothetical protein